ncbi:MAG: SDR family NAD(P)-dependent oxidoreductase [Tissierellia bacterium]|nr:SDR family NAD(P)-dependent oxidoreductase [Tissierellia bacterium]
MKLKDKIVILTGASSGIGYAIGKLFAKEGATLIAVARRVDLLEKLKEETQGEAGQIIPMQGDVSSQEDVDRVVQETINQYGRIDVLINNAGVLDNYQSAGAVEDDVWERVLNINVTGVMRMTRAVINHMVEKKNGVIINTSSVGGLHGMRGGLGYVATKHAVVGMTKNIGFTYADDGIRCVCVAPGSYATDIGQKVTGVDNKTLDKLMLGFNFFPKFGNPDELAPLYAFLASDDAVFINGTTIVSDGGWTAF